MKFFADFHIHSKYSRATSKNLDLEHIYAAAQKKGISVIATGDFTHPAWFSEIKEKLVYSKNGLFQLKEAVLKGMDLKVPVSCRQPVYFILSCEISNIYKKDGRVRKNHNLVLLPDMESAESFIHKMEKIGNIHSDGRPILGLDARDLLEIVLETSESAFLIPAHIWTPWFSLFGSKSGFDSLKACFEDLAPHIFALETGLSSDPEMNWRVSDLDDLALVSNSDAHSPEKIAREANVFDTEISFSGIRSALLEKNGITFKGTLEFFPEEGKYHLDGHRKCGIRLHPEETRKKQGRCPECGKPLTRGVLHRIMEIGDRKNPKKPEGALPFHRLLPLADILSDVLQVGASSKKVAIAQKRLIEKFGPELNILHQIPLDALKDEEVPLLGEALRRVRNGEIFIQPGYDGQFGTLKIFSDLERRRLLGQRSLFAFSAQEKTDALKDKSPVFPGRKTQKIAIEKKDGRKEDAYVQKKRNLVNPEQERAIHRDPGPILVIAGPGTGKTHTLIQRILNRILSDGVLPETILAVTFTQKAAAEMKERISRALKAPSAPHIGTFHAFCLDVLKECALKRGESVSVIDENDRRYLISDAVKLHPASAKSGRILVDDVLKEIVFMKQHMPWQKEVPVRKRTTIDPPILMEIFQTYQALLRVQRLMDFEDLISKTVCLFETRKDVRHTVQQKFKHLFIDEFQDINQAQYRLIRLLYPKTDPSRDLFVIGDPNQAIYGFRGSDVKFFHRFSKDYPEATIVRLVQNYRSTKILLSASKQVLRSPSKTPKDVLPPVNLLKAAKINISGYSDEGKEAEGIAERIEALVGGSGYFFVDSGKSERHREENLWAFSDMAVLFRTHRQGEEIAKNFGKLGIPYQFVRKKALMNEAAAGVFSVLKMAHQRGTFADMERAFKAVGFKIGKKALLDFKIRCLKEKISTWDLLTHLFHGASREKLNAPTKRLLLGYGELEKIKRTISGLTLKEQLLFLSKAYGSLQQDKKDDTWEGNLEKLIRLAGDCSEDLDRFLEVVSLATDTDVYDERAQRVSLLTLHAAKGLEFPVVFISGCEDGLIPFFIGKTKEVDPEEERRLFYVGLTRAKERLFLTWAKRRRLFGQVHRLGISPFVLNIHEDLIQYQVKKDKRPERDGQVQLSLF